jgi:murein DD-endopeptidase MepM/ murein hydrolase activator NlpD
MDGNIPYQWTVNGYKWDYGNYGVRYINPVDNSISKKYMAGWTETSHKGVDIPVPEGTGVNAGASGKVIFAGNVDNAGNMLIIEHDFGYVTKYMHLKNDSFKVGVGDYVQNGQTIAEVGSTGKSEGPHLHYQIEMNGNSISPYIDLQLYIDIQKGFFIPDTDVVPQRNIAAP